MKKGKVLVAMSGGVDSSVALLKILELGYKAVGVTMKLWEYDDVGGNILSDTNCCSIESVTKAKMVCDQMGIPHYTLDFTDIFKKDVVNNFIEEYLSGRTPNPCVRCNSHLKWDALLEQAKKLNADYISTGHYARIELVNGEYFLKKGVDPKKDQSYVLWGISENTLEKTIFPLGGLTKSEVRAIAKKHNLESANTPESQDICFVPDNNYSRFLNDTIPKEMKNIQGGDIIENEKVVGTHSGYTNYTIGQRKGLGLSNPEPRYVRKINSTENTIEVGKKDSLFSNLCKVTEVNWLVNHPELPRNAEVHIRYNSPGAEAEISGSLTEVLVTFAEPQLAITPGQSAVFYDGDIVLGGGVIV
ncbi:MAG: tRNA 2-thiouridine(34) synthase MnmA [Candidatus Marinimicrobia bacterium]|nr:tRNA 2-thiouridine(34) synthase MnmA [Candidatus Neomarinimicrobiota bacterium]MBL7022856.1 tRNA 2-thiouridine(34) synthase MnmA [Candidatus Neomarinimicrobiota bacterium]MBL7110044.1 tRNA 2-thiouridine(34) synthase MnmA [Candidatus Neomarinimicrobiota bacterium]